MAAKKNFEDCYDLIYQEINKRRRRWIATNTPHISFEDVRQEILRHVWVKWDLWDQNRPLEKWLNRVITNQIRNLQRNNYLNFVRPCYECPLNPNKEDMDSKSCLFTKSKLQDASECPILARWQKNKLDAHNVKIPVSIENHTHEIQEKRCSSVDMEGAVEKIHEEMEKQLSPEDFELYDMLIIQGTDEAEVASFLGYKTTEKNRRPGYKQIKQLKTFFSEKVQRIIDDQGICSG